MSTGNYLSEFASRKKSRVIDSRCVKNSWEREGWDDKRKIMDEKSPKFGSLTLVSNLVVLEREKIPEVLRGMTRRLDGAKRRAKIMWRGRFYGE